ncbi:MAG: hypothetical protein OXH04_02525 [Acidobacteria bacterium]|nr:hypothetical protein [Acidobacteriota bacterium]
MRGSRAVLTLAAALAVGVVAAADARAQTTDDAPPAADDAPLTADEIPISFDRVQRELDRALRAPNAGRRLRLNDYVTVYARLPALDLIENTFDLSQGPIPHGAPTRVEMLNAMTPREWRTQGVNLANVIGWTVRRINR